MLSYDIDEAIVMLQDKLATAKKGLQLANEDLGFLRDQITTMEVNTARVHNWDVKRRRDKFVGPKDVSWQLTTGNNEKLDLRNDA